MPAPNSSSTGDTAPSPKPATRVSSGCTWVITTNTPAKPSMVVSSPSSTCGRAMVASSARSGTGVSPPRLRGTSAAITSSEASPTTTIAQNVERQPKCRPSQAPAGMPSRVARVRPENMTEIAEALRASGTSPVATTAPTPKNVPWVSEVSTRAAISVA